MKSPVQIACDRIYEVLIHRKGKVIDEAVARDAAANAATALLGLLGEGREETAEEMAERLIK